VTVARVADERPKWWQLRRRLNGKFYVLVTFLLSLLLVGASTSVRLSKAPTLHQLEEWRIETTVTWNATLKQMDRIEKRQRRIYDKLGALKACRKTGGQ
jgi:hypothetical protein